MGRHHVYFGVPVKTLPPYSIKNPRPYNLNSVYMSAPEMGVATDIIDPLVDLPDALHDLDALRQDKIRADYWNQIPSDWDSRYLHAFQNHLNVGVYYCAGVMNYLKGKYTECEKGIEEELTQKIQVLIADYAAMGVMAFLLSL